jgi:hypothetical protein
MRLNDRFGTITNNQGNNYVNDRFERAKNNPIPNGSNYVNDKFEKAKNNPMVAIMLMIDLYKLKKQPNIIVMSNDRFQKVENNLILQLSESMRDWGKLKIFVFWNPILQLGK